MVGRVVGIGRSFLGFGRPAIDVKRTAERCLKEVYGWMLLERLMLVGILEYLDTRRTPGGGEKRVAAVRESRNMRVSIRRPPISMYSALEYVI
jgi:hypothetical protein